MPASNRDLDLPSLDALRVFEVTARRLNFSKAAEELHVTQSAISHRIRELERQLQTRLFQRGHRSLQLTPAGRTLADGIQRGLGTIREALASLDNRQPKSTLNVSVLTSFATRWLTPRLADFHQRFPRIDLMLQADDRLVDLASYGVDASIRFGSGDYPGMSVVRLFGDSTVPVCSPSLAEKFGPIRKPADIVRCPLLHDTYAEHNVHSESGADWYTWLRRVGAGDVPNVGGLRFSNANLAIDAAANGMGFALARVSLLGSDLRTGRLVCPLPFTVATNFSYYFLCLPQRESDSKVRTFRDWLLDEAKKPPFDNNGIAFTAFDGARRA
jgi:LysR family transcriptional regulator, glycine cleavage system transcriptional activator